MVLFAFYKSCLCFNFAVHFDNFLIKFFLNLYNLLIVEIELNLQRLLRNSLISFLFVFCGFSFGQDPDPLAGKKLFNANCAACHKLNKKAVGPALKGVTSKYEKEWLYSWIKNS